MDNVGQWPKAAFFWSQIGAPLRPVPEDVQICNHAIQEWYQQNQNQKLRALILGVTPEFFHLQWPSDTSLFAIDRTEAMIDHVWPGSKDSAILANWLEMPFQQASRDMVLCDGGLHLLSYPDEQIKLAQNLANILTPQGYVIFRLFVPPIHKENSRDVLSELLEGKIPNLNFLKLRLGMALQQNPKEGTALASVWQALAELEPNQEKFSERLGWSLDHFSAINAYHDSQARYHFVSVEEACEVFCKSTKGAFSMQQLVYPKYPMGSQCPTFILRREI